MWEVNFPGILSISRRRLKSEKQKRKNFRTQKLREACGECILFTAELKKDKFVISFQRISFHLISLHFRHLIPLTPPRFNSLNFISFGFKWFNFTCFHFISSYFMLFNLIWIPFTRNQFILIYFTSILFHLISGGFISLPSTWIHFTSKHYFSFD